MCRVSGCTELHATHLCRACGDGDSDHFRRHCARAAASRPRCKAAGCTEEHAAHYCSKCLSVDSDHCARACPAAASMSAPAASPAGGAPRRLHCRVPGCPFDHAVHQCWKCKSADADHRSAHCKHVSAGVSAATKYCRGRRLKMYHGTDPAAATAICQQGFRRSSDGMLGAGVYVTRDPKKASAYGSVILELIVSVGKVKKIDRQGHPLQKTWSAAGYDSAWVPPGCGMVASGLEENCVWDPARVTVLGIFRG